jgi:hypothetical protein
LEHLQQIQSNKNIDWSGLEIIFPVLVAAEDVHILYPLQIHSKSHLKNYFSPENCIVKKILFRNFSSKNSKMKA